MCPSFDLSIVISNSIFSTLTPLLVILGKTIVSIRYESVLGSISSSSIKRYLIDLSVSFLFLLEIAYTATGAKIVKTTREMYTK